jgi:hypothetical protein
MRDIMSRDVLQKPRHVIDGKLVSSGRIPTPGIVVESIRTADSRA